MVLSSLKFLRYHGSPLDVLSCEFQELGSASLSCYKLGIVGAAFRRSGRRHAVPPCYLGVMVPEE